MINFFKKSSAWAFSIITAIFTFVPETFFEKIKLLPKHSDSVNIIVSRVGIFIFIWVLSIVVNALYLSTRRSVSIKGNNYNIQVKYGNILKMKNCKAVIPFDECFTTSVGNFPSDINPNSLCGQYLKKHPIDNMQDLIESANLKPVRSKSDFQSKTRYTSGKLIPRDEYLLLSFAKLDKDGLGKLSRSEFIDCLFTLWEEIDKFHGQKDVCIPIIGSGVTRMGDESLTQQVLLDIIIESYKLSTHKLKAPYKIYIVCKKREGFSLNKIGTTL